jgi:hypothetical protein
LAGYLLERRRNIARDVNQPDREIAAERPMMNGGDAGVVRRELDSPIVTEGPECAQSLAATIEPSELGDCTRIRDGSCSSTV